MRHYRAAFNGEFIEILPTETSPKITEEDIKELLDNFDNIDIWKEKFPLNSYIFKGFGLMNLFDVTTDETVTAIRTNLLRSDENLTDDLRTNIGDFFSIKDIQLGYSIFNKTTNNIESTRLQKSNSLLLETSKGISCDGTQFCSKVLENVLKNAESLAISDVDKYGKRHRFQSILSSTEKEEHRKYYFTPYKIF